MALKLKLEDGVHEVEIVGRRPHLTVRIDGRLHTIADLGPAGDGSGTVTLDGADLAFERIARAGACLVRIDGRTITVDVVDPFDEGGGAGGGRDEILAPMPGAVVHVHRSAGDEVARGEAVLTIESMKLQTTLVAPRDGVLVAVLKGEGDTFEKDEVIARLAPVEGDQ
ncbi:acetyl-CoA carboxylase biotin carboxyl carrier protein subunit [Xanthobacter flavus]|uniref:acetyl-CoA carboxylase biotin carboxyl carrier protein subunit n=1 Tax=Xanthobacter flavus TaxID=281 RepID=UPI00372A1BDA